jgi:hypothetical protein
MEDGMGDKNSSGPAFPTPPGVRVQDGMSLRDYFAAKALPVVLNETENFLEDGVRDLGLITWGDYAQVAYAIADAMLAERAK